MYKVQKVALFFFVEMGLFTEAVDMNGRFQMQGGKNWFLPKEMNANRFFWDSHWLEIWSNHFYPSMGPNGGSVAMDSGNVNLASKYQNTKTCLRYKSGRHAMKMKRIDDVIQVSSFFHHWLRESALRILHWQWEAKRKQDVSPQRQYNVD